MLYKRTHMCGQLRLADKGENVVLNGWVSKARSLGGLVFVDIRDKTGITQVTFNEDVPADVLEKGAMDPKKCCITCSLCTQIMRDHGTTGCVIRNSSVYMPLYKKFNAEAVEREHRK